ncbi:hypothetical protein, partial [Staphylococcus aureus]|uniref:hypothetical protein n=1 Tax=Staphylococcus aureus TaxID=1280 RepID=UPI0038B2A02E
DQLQILGGEAAAIAEGDGQCDLSFALHPNPIRSRGEPIMSRALRAVTMRPDHASIHPGPRAISAGTHAAKGPAKLL